MVDNFSKMLQGICDYDIDDKVRIYEIVKKVANLNLRNREIFRDAYESGWITEEDFNLLKKDFLNQEKQNTTAAEYTFTPSTRNFDPKDYITGISDTCDVLYTPSMRITNDTLYINTNQVKELVINNEEQEQRVSMEDLIDILSKKNKKPITSIYLKPSGRKCSISDYECFDIYDQDMELLDRPDCDVIDIAIEKVKFGNLYLELVNGMIHLWSRYKKIDFEPLIHTFMIKVKGE